MYCYLLLSWFFICRMKQTPPLTLNIMTNAYWWIVYNDAANVATCLKRIISANIVLRLRIVTSLVAQWWRKKKLERLVDKWVLATISIIYIWCTIHPISILIPHPHHLPHPHSILISPFSFPILISILIPRTSFPILIPRPHSPSSFPVPISCPCHAIHACMKQTLLFRII